MRSFITHVCIAMIVVMLILPGCSDAPIGPVADPGVYSIVIGAVFHLTGPASYWGSGERDAVVMAVDEANERGGIEGRQIKLIIEDGKTDFVHTTSSLNKLIEVDRVSVIIGPTWFGQAAAPIANVSGTVMISPSTGVTVARDRHFFNLWPSERQEVSPLVAYMASKGIRKVAIVYSQNDWSASMRDVFIAESQLAKISVIKGFASSPDESDFRSIILDIKSLDADAVYAPFAFYPSQGAFSKQAEELNLSIPIFSSSGTQNPDLVNSFPQVEGTVYPYPVAGPGESDFVKRFKSRFNRDPSPSSAYAYDAANMVIDAMRSGARSSEDFASYLASVKDYAGVSNVMTFDQKTGRVIEKDYEMRRVEGGRFVKI
ncbi:MAG: ABC transporter substrate-binding protein [Nanoarchaeota archaeon]